MLNWWPYTTAVRGVLLPHHRLQPEVPRRPWVDPALRGVRQRVQLVLKLVVRGVRSVVDISSFFQN